MILEIYDKYNGIISIFAGLLIFYVAYLKRSKNEEETLFIHSAHLPLLKVVSPFVVLYGVIRLIQNLQ